MDTPDRRLRELLEPIYPEARALCRRLARSDADGDDLFHEALERALLRLDDLRDPDAFRAWLFRIAVNQHRSRGRSWFWRRAEPIDDEPGADGRDDLDARAGAARMRAALQSLPAVQRTAIVLANVHDMSVDEIAAIQNSSAATVKSRLARGRRRLRAIYEKRYGVVAARIGAAELGA